MKARLPSGLCNLKFRFGLHKCQIELLVKFVVPQVLGELG